MRDESAKNEGIQRHVGLKGGIKTITFSNVESEYDLDQNFIFATTYARCVLVGACRTGINSFASKLMGMRDVIAKVNGASVTLVVLVAAYGELSSESVVIRLERIVKIGGCATDNNGFAARLQCMRACIVNMVNGSSVTLAICFAGF